MHEIYVGKHIQIAVSLHVKNRQGQANPPVIEIILQTPNFECLYTVK